MSAAITSGQDLILSSKLPEVPSLFTTFATGHFIKPGEFSQPVAKKVATVFSYSEVFVAAPLDLDYEEPNAVHDQEMELVTAGTPVHYVQVAVVNRGKEVSQPIASKIAA